MKSFFKEEFRIYVQILMSYQTYIHVWVCVCECVCVCVCVCVWDRLYIEYEVLTFKLALFSFSIPILKTPETLNLRS